MLDFPNNPAVGDRFDKWEFDGDRWAIVAEKAAIFVGPIPPDDPPPNVLWFDSIRGGLFFLFNDGDSIQWVNVAGRIGPLGPRGLPGQRGPVGLGGTLSQYMHVFTASDDYVPSPGLVSSVLECVGGGASGGAVLGAASWHYRTCGGGSGGYSRTLATAAEIGVSQPVIIGPGGLGAAWNVASGAGNAGGDTSIGILCIAKGALASVNWHTPARGAPVGVGDFTAEGAPGQGGGAIVAANGWMLMGAGGSSIFGGGGEPVGVTQDASWTLGNPGRNYGSGGSGAGANNTGAGPNGGVGSPGVAIITELCVN